MLTEVPEYFRTVWTDYDVKDDTMYDTLIDITTIGASESVRSVALNFSRYNAYDTAGYGESNFTNGVTEQQAFNDWILQWENENSKVLKSIFNLNILKITQNQYDAIVLFNWTTGDVYTVASPEGQYDLRSVIQNKNWDSVADMMSRSTINKEKSVLCAKLLRLADYDSFKDRIWLRTQGIHDMRKKNELRLLDSQQLRFARFAYFAETGDFLPYTPEGIKRDIVKKYNNTLIQQRFESDGTTTQFKLTQAPSIYPVEKIKVLINGQQIQLYYDYTVDNTTLTITHPLVSGDLIDITIKI